MSLYVYSTDHLTLFILHDLSLARQGERVGDSERAGQSISSRNHLGVLREIDER